MNKLLKQAKASKSKHYKQGFTTKDDIELAVAWAKGEVTTGQVAAAYEIKNGSSNCYHRLAMALRAHVQQQKV